MINVSVVISNYNEEKFVRDCLDNLRKIMETNFPKMEVIVKNQGSSDNSPNIIKSEYPWVVFIDGENDGLSKGFNIAVRKSRGKYILFLGMDAIPNPDTIPGLFNYFEKNENAKVGAATCKLVTKDGSLDMDAHRGFPTPWTSFCRLCGLSAVFPNVAVFNRYFLVGENLDEPHEIDLCISHFMFTRRNTLDEIGGFDESYFLYGEDVDTCYKIKQAGWKIMYLPQWEALHWKGGSVGIRKTTRHLIKRPLKHRLKMQRLSTEAMAVFLKKHYMDKYPRPLIYLMLISSYILGKKRVFMESLRK
jgi:GT2 family glycosyltransferase